MELVKIEKKIKIIIIRWQMHIMIAYFCNIVYRRNIISNYWITELDQVDVTSKRIRSAIDADKIKICDNYYPGLILRLNKIKLEKIVHLLQQQY